MRKPLSCAAVLLVVSHGLASHSLEAQADLWAGCYDLELRAWHRRVGGADTLYYSPPPRVRLDTTRAADPWAGDGRVVVPAPGSPPSVHRFAVWEQVHPDTVALTWSTGFTGLRMRLGRAGQALRGHATTFIDVSPYEPHRADVVAAPVPCDAPMPPQHASWRSFPTAVPLETGDTLALGRPVPEALPLDLDRRSTYWIRARPAGLFTDATHASVALDDRRTIRRIDVFFEPRLGLEALESRLTAALGPPTGRRVQAADVWISWTGREGHSFSLWRRTTPGGEDLLTIMIAAR